MAKLRITDAQKTGIIDPIDADLHAAFNEGVDTATVVTVLPMMTKYDTLTDQVAPPTDTRTGQQSVRDIFRQMMAAIIAVLGITGPFAAGAFVAGQSVTISYKKSDGSTGTMTFTNGILTANT
jgi:hypothetical protein